MKASKREHGEPNREDYDQAEMQIKYENIFLREGRERWLEIIRDYYANFEHNQKLESEAISKPQKSTRDKLIESFVQGAGDVHHRLSSSIYTLLSAFVEKKFYTLRQLVILNKIRENATDKGKVKRYSTEVVVKRGHPIDEIYDRFLSSPTQITNDELELLKKDANRAGASVAMSTSLEEVLSWFWWANGQKYIQEGRTIPSLFFKLAQGGMLNSTEEEKELLKEALSLTNALQSDQKISMEEVKDLEKKSKLAQDKWVKLFFSKIESNCPSFSDYIKKK